MLEAILPTSVSVVETRSDIPSATLFAEEAASIRRAVPSRRREFATARACARAALERQGLPRRAIPVGSRGAPRWPAGVVGSITHCDGYRGCGVALSRDLLTIGVDAEPNESLPHGLLSEIAVSRERAWVGELSRRAPRVHWDRLLFCMKEAAYKAWSPLTERRLGFEQAVVSVDRAAGSFAVRLGVPGPRVGGEPLTELSGRWLSRDGILLAAIARPAAARR